MKKLVEMSLEELWQLFPIELTPPNAKWVEYYGEMEQTLKGSLYQLNTFRISHIGSTAVYGIWAKPIVDMLLEVENIDEMNYAAEKICDLGFIKMSSSGERISFNYGYTDESFAEKVYHLHLRIFGDNKELYFRDYLNENPTIAKEYEGLKLRLWKEYEHDRDGYTQAKTPFISHYTAEAIKKFNGRY